MVGLKLTYGGSIPSFLELGFVLVQKQVLRMYGRVGGSRGVILHWLML